MRESSGEAAQEAVGNEPILRQVKSLTKAGGGLAVYVPAHLTSSVGFVPGERVDFVARTEWGRLIMEVRPHRGVGPNELLSLAKGLGWKVVEQRLSDASSWFLLFRADPCNIQADGWTHVGDDLLFNIAVTTDPLRLTSPEAYQKLVKLGRSNNLRVSVSDPEGIWVKSKFSAIGQEKMESSGPIERLLSLVSHVGVRFELLLKSPASTPDDVSNGVKRVSAAYKKALRLTRPLVA